MKFNIQGNLNRSEIVVGCKPTNVIVVSVLWRQLSVWKMEITINDGVELFLEWCFFLLMFKDILLFAHMLF